ncbi:MAG: AbrB family transcriptional regulator [Verrucomicrobia bacterium]|jgi:AbrB family looped-hinge helix DNA binding protein|nr:AbrB family transcriptional regulator [Verrucomicrobiota bacterium]
MRLTQKGQVTVPKRMRDQFGLKAGVQVAFESTPAGLLLRPLAAQQEESLKDGIRAIRGSADSSLSTSDILQMTRGTGDTR